MAPSTWKSELVFDHAFILVRDLDEADERLRMEFGLGSVWLGSFQGDADAANRIVPLQNGYLELLAPTLDASDQSNYWLSTLEQRGEHIAGWAMRTDRLHEAGRDLSIPVEAGPGQWLDELDLELRWSVIWPLDDPDYVPFLIQYDDFPFFRRFLDSKLSESHHANIPKRVSRVELHGDADIVRQRIGPDPVASVTEGSGRIAGLTIDVEGGPLEVRWDGPV